MRSMVLALRRSGKAIVIQEHDLLGGANRCKINDVDVVEAKPAGAEAQATADTELEMRAGTFLILCTMLLMVHQNVRTEP